MLRRQRPALVRRRLVYDLLERFVYSGAERRPLEAAVPRLMPNGCFWRTPATQARSAYVSS